MFNNVPNPDFMISTGQAIIIGIWAAIAIAGSLLGNYTATPLIYAAGVGIILGDVQNAVIIGAAGQLVWLGFGIGQGGVRPPDPIAPGIFATVLGVQQAQVTGVPVTIADAGQWIGISIPIGILFQFIFNAVYTLMSPLVGLSRKAVEKDRYMLFYLYSNLTIFIFMIIAFIVGIAIGFSANVVGQAAQQFPNWLSQGLKVVGGLLPALGFALILKVMMKREYIGFALLGYFLELVFEAIATGTGASISVFALAVTALGVALIILAVPKLANLTAANGPSNANVSVASSKGEDDGI
ncbi:PTS sugar transporter subunit IIC [[Mycoplasma] testudinis]|uniref:PTS sugar transporter subunit IIC n=1 Tax=[Mycoplasma] testudinis TaxID=33924 RepID=UPI0004896DA7|nr:PTS sugar transporter subunit IIC [[Mycoplasma] testudinis]